MVVLVEQVAQVVEHPARLDIAQRAVMLHQILAAAAAERVAGNTIIVLVLLAV